MLRKLGQGVHSVGDAACHAANKVKDGATEGVHLAEGGAHAIVGGTKTVGGVAVHGASSVATAVSHPVDTAHVVGDGMTHLAHVGVDAVENGIVAVKGSMVHAHKFFNDVEYRENEALPSIKSAVREAGAGVKEELEESEQMVRLLYAYGVEGQELTPEEYNMVKAQMADLAKIVPVLGIFLLPGGGVLLPIAAKILPFDLFPSAFYRGQPDETVVARATHWADFCASNMLKCRMDHWQAICASNLIAEEGVPPVETEGRQ